MARTSPAPLDRLIDWDDRCTRRLHRAATYPLLLRALQWASRLGDGVVWYAAIGAFAVLGGAKGLECAAHMTAAGLIGVAIVHRAKQLAARMRPYERLVDVRLCARALDPFSFPSGHVLHAVGFTVVIGFHYPALALALVPFAGLVALSRVVLGLHYPSDVLAGGLLGAIVAVAVTGIG